MYYGVSFFQFFIVFFQRLTLFISGQLPLTELASDEIQVAIFLLMGITSALLGALLVLRKMTMLANALSHTILLGIVIAFLVSVSFAKTAELTLANLSMSALLIASCITALLTTLCVQWLTRTRLFSDASIGLVFNVFFALGVTLVTLLTRNTHLGVEAIMGNADALHIHDLKLMSWVFLITAASIFIFYKEWHITTFDSTFAYTLGFAPKLMGYILMVLTALVAIGSFRIVGVFLFLGLLIFPTLTARLFTNRLKPLMALACAISATLSLISVALSRHLAAFIPLSTAGIFITLMTFVYACAIAIKAFGHKKTPLASEESLITNQ